MKVICNGHKTCIAKSINIKCKHNVIHEFCDTGESACEKIPIFNNCVCESINKERKEKLKRLLDNT